MLSLHILSVDSKRKILGHNTILVNDFDASFFEICAETAESIVLIEFGSVEETSCPGKDGCDGIGGCFVTLLPFTVVSCDGSCSKTIKKYQTGERKRDEP